MNLKAKLGNSFAIVVIAAMNIFVLLAVLALLSALFSRS